MLSFLVSIYLPWNTTFVIEIVVCIPLVIYILAVKEDIFDMHNNSGEIN
jgi:hypothetical protein